MPTAQERAKALAKEVMKAMREARAAEARVAVLSKEMANAVAEAKAEAEAAAQPKTIFQYPAGRYECASCRHGVLFTEPTEELPECDNCGSREYTGHEPTVTVIAPPAPKLYQAGMYQCDSCGARIAVAVGTDELSPCEFCGQQGLTHLG